MQAGGIRNHDRFGRDRCPQLSVARGCSPPSKVDVKSVSFPADDVAAGAFPRRHASLLAMTICVSRLFACVARKSRSNSISGAPARTRVADLDARVKSFALQRHGVDADVHQHLDAFRRAQRHRVPGRVQRDDFAVARRDEHGVGGIDRQAVADHLLREDRIGHAFERPDYTGERRPQRDHTTLQFNGRNKSPQS